MNDNKKNFVSDDGTQYRKEKDGSMTRIYDDSTQNPSGGNFKVMSDGKIYRTEANGDMTFIGYADNQSMNSETPNGNGNKNKMWIIIVLVAIIAGLTSFYIVHQKDSPQTETVDNPTTTPSTIGDTMSATLPSMTTADVVAPAASTTVEEVEIPAEPEPSPAELEERFRNDGLFVGTVAGKGVHGYFNFYSGTGWIYYDAMGANNKMQLTMDGGGNWDEYHDGEYKGTYSVTSENLSKKNFMKGRYYRARDGKDFSFSFKRKNF